MIDIAKRRADRLRVLDAVFDQSGGREDIFIDAITLSFQLQLNDDDLADAIQFLAEECLVKPSIEHNGRKTPSHLQITHDGVVAVEEARTTPQIPTGLFPAHVTITQTFHAPVSGVVFQQASPGAQQSTGTTKLSEPGI